MLLLIVFSRWWNECECGLCSGGWWRQWRGGVRGFTRFLQGFKTNITQLSPGVILQTIQTKNINLCNSLTSLRFNQYFLKRLYSYYDRDSARHFLLSSYNFITFWWSSDIIWTQFFNGIILPVRFVTAYSLGWFGSQLCVNTLLAFI